MTTTTSHCKCGLVWKWLCRNIVQWVSEVYNFLCIKITFINKHPKTFKNNSCKCFFTTDKTICKIGNVWIPIEKNSWVFRPSVGLFHGYYLWFYKVLSVLASIRHCISMNGIHRIDKQIKKHIFYFVSAY